MGSTWGGAIDGGQEMWGPLEMGGAGAVGEGKGVPVLRASHCSLGWVGGWMRRAALL